MFYSGGNFELSTVPQGLAGFGEGGDVEGLRYGHSRKGFREMPFARVQTFRNVVNLVDALQIMHQ